MTTTNEKRDESPMAGREYPAGDSGGKIGKNLEDSKAIGQDDPIAEGSRQGRERYKSSPESETEEGESI